MATRCVIAAALEVMAEKYRTLAVSGLTLHGIDCIVEAEVVSSKNYADRGHAPRRQGGHRDERLQWGAPAGWRPFATASLELRICGTESIR